MKYLLNTLFIALFLVTVGCSNELTGFDADINPISSQETVLSTNSATGLNNPNTSGLLSADGKTMKDNSALTDGGEPEVIVNDGGDDDDTLPPPVGG